MKLGWKALRPVVATPLFAALLCAPAASASLGGDAHSGPVSIGGRGVWFDPIDGDGDWHGGGQLRFHLNPVVALEGSADYRRNDFGATEVHTYPVQASLMIYPFTGTRVAPFILGGAGWYFTTVDPPGGGSNTQHRFGPHAGAGLQIFLSQFLSVDASYRYVWVEDITSRDDTNVFNKDYSDRGSMITAALNLHFGRSGD